MTESQVWQYVVSHLDAQRIEIYCGCPPGATCYRFPNCSLSNGTSSDAPDLIFSLNGAIVFCECKPTFLGINSRVDGESDIDKLERLLANARTGKYETQFAANFGIQTSSDTRFLGALAYSGNPGDEQGYLHFITDSSGGVQLLDLT